jgi:nitrile hydratase subunit beta
MTFAVGDEVLVKDEWPETKGPVHIRTPHYVRGRKGQVRRALGAHPNPEDLAFARPAARAPLYHVVFPMSELWPEGRANEELIVELYEHWLVRP